MFGGLWLSDTVMVEVNIYKEGMHIFKWKIKMDKQELSETKSVGKVLDIWCQNNDREKKAFNKGKNKLNSYTMTSFRYVYKKIMF